MNLKLCGVKGSCLYRWKNIEENNEYNYLDNDAMHTPYQTILMNK